MKTTAILRGRENEGYDTKWHGGHMDESIT
jgi:hypothetical protein